MYVHTRVRFHTASRSRRDGIECKGIRRRLAGLSDFNYQQKGGMRRVEGAMIVHCDVRLQNASCDLMHVDDVLMRLVYGNWNTLSYSPMDYYFEIEKSKDEDLKVIAGRLHTE